MVSLVFPGLWDLASRVPKALNIETVFHMDQLPRGQLILSQLSNNRYPRLQEPREPQKDKAE